MPRSFVGFVIQESAVTVSGGEPNVFEHKLESGITMKRVFCETCGSYVPLVLHTSFARIDHNYLQGFMDSDS
jgi:hypothetical protein